MTLAAMGFLAVPMTKLRDTVASSATFRSVVGAADATAALDRIHLQEASDELDEQLPEETPNYEDPLPRAIVATASDWGRTAEGPGEWRATASWLVSFEFLIPEPYDKSRNESCVWFMNQVGTILREMEVSRDSDVDGSTLPFDSYAFVADPMPCDDDEHRLEFWGVSLQFFVK